MMVWLLLIALGVATGVLSGLVGIGGGIIIVPALVLLFGFTQKTAQGTSLAVLLPPISILATLAYYKHGNVNLAAAGLIIVGFLVGSFFGARYITNLSNGSVSKIFGIFLLIIAVRMLIGSKG